MLKIAIKFFFLLECIVIILYYLSIHAIIISNDTYMYLYLLIFESVLLPCGKQLSSAQTLRNSSKLHAAVTLAKKYA